MAEQARRRYEVSWDELETGVHVPEDQQVISQDVTVHEPLATPEDLDRLRAFGMSGGYPVS